MMDILLVIRTYQTWQVQSNSRMICSDIFNQRDGDSSVDSDGRLTQRSDYDELQSCTVPLSFMVTNSQLSQHSQLFVFSILSSDSSKTMMDPIPF